MANMYRSSLQAGGVQPTGDAVAADVLTGKTFSNANAVGISGSMANNGAVSQTLAAGASYTIPEGYHNGSGTVTAQGATMLGGITGSQGETLNLTGLKVGDILFGYGTPYQSGLGANADTLTGLTLKTSGSYSVHGGGQAYLEVTANNPSIVLQNLGGHAINAIAVRGIA